MHKIKFAKCHFKLEKTNIQYSWDVSFLFSICLRCNYLYKIKKIAQITATHHCMVPCFRVISVYYVIVPYPGHKKYNYNLQQDLCLILFVNFRGSKCTHVHMLCESSRPCSTIIVYISDSYNIQVWALCPDLRALQYRSHTLYK